MTMYMPGGMKVAGILSSGTTIVMSGVYSGDLPASAAGLRSGGKRRQ